MLIYKQFKLFPNRQPSTNPRNSYKLSFQLLIVDISKPMRQLGYRLRTSYNVCLDTRLPQKVYVCEPRLHIRALTASRSNAADMSIALVLCTVMLVTIMLYL